MSRRLSLAALVLPALLLFLPAPVFASASEDLFAAWQKFMALTSFRATIQSVEPSLPATRAEFQAPDRFRIIVEGAPPMLLVGDSAYIDIGGRTMKVPLPIKSMTAQYRDESFLRKLQEGMAVDDLGADEVDGEAVRKYRYITDAVPVPPTPGAAPVASTGDKATTVAWVSVERGLILKLQVSSVVDGKPYRTEVRYSGFDDPAIAIKVPE